VIEDPAIGGIHPGLLILIVVLVLYWYYNQWKMNKEEMGESLNE
jgi:hypothetical protein